MMDEIKKVLLFGVGAVASTYERATEVVDDLVKKGKITIDEGKELGEELKRTFKEKAKEKEELSNTNGNNIRNIEASNYVLRDEYEILKARVYNLEKLVNKEDEK